MTLYADSRYPVSPTIEALHVDEMQSYARSGTWGTAAQRTAIAATARIAQYEQGLHCLLYTSPSPRDS